MAETAPMTSYAGKKKKKPIKTPLSRGGGKKKKAAGY